MNWGKNLFGNPPIAMQHSGVYNSNAGKLVVINSDRLFRACLSRALKSVGPYEVVECDKIELAAKELTSGSGTMLLIIGLERDALTESLQQVEALGETLGDNVLIIVTGDVETPGIIAGLLQSGVKGYLPTSIDLDVAIHAIRLVLAGGMFAPASCLLATDPAEPGSAETGSEQLRTLTAKQLAVLEAIKLGKANKTIAYELNMCESTVKVHVRNIMKKLGARNRTQVAYIANQGSMSQECNATRDQPANQQVATDRPLTRGKTNIASFMRSSSPVEPVDVRPQSD